MLWHLNVCLQYSSAAHLRQPKAKHAVISLVATTGTNDTACSDNQHTHDYQDEEHATTIESLSEQLVLLRNDTRYKPDSSKDAPAIGFK